MAQTSDGRGPVPSFQVNQLPPSAGGQAWAFPTVYFNGFALTLGSSDTSLVVTLDGQPLLKLAMSFTTAKTLSSFLQDLVLKLETATQHPIMKTDEVEAGLLKLHTEGL
jgi:hypothetical protein